MAAQVYTVDDIDGLNYDGIVLLMKAIYGRRCWKGTCPICDAKRGKEHGETEAADAE